MKVYHKSPQTLGINPTCLQNLSVPIGEGQRVKSRVNSTVMTVNQNNNFSESNNNLFNQLENTSMRNTNSNQFSNNSGFNPMNSNIQTPTYPDLSFRLVNQKEISRLIDFLRVRKELSRDVEDRRININLMRLVEDDIYNYGNMVSVTSIHHKIYKGDNETDNNVFKNTYNKINQRYEYVEGIVVSKLNPYDRFYHSWNLTPDGEHVDFTLRESDEFDYYGIVIPNDKVKQVVKSIKENVYKQGFLHLPILPFLVLKKIDVNFRNRNNKSGGTVK